MLKSGVKATVGKHGTFQEFNQAVSMLTAPEQDQIDEVLDAITDADERDAFRIKAVLTGPEMADTVTFLQMVARKPTAAEAVAYLRREHYLEKPPLATAHTSVIEGAKKAVAAVDANVQSSGLVNFAQTMRTQAETWAKK
jgi:hypothetical protein